MLDKFIKLGFPKESINFMFGITMGLFIMLIRYLVDRSNSNDHITYLIIAISILIYFKNLQIALFSMIIPIIYQLISYDITNVMYYEVSTLFLIIFVVELLRNITNLNQPWFPLIATLLTLVMISIPLAFTVFANYDILILLEQTLFSYLWAIIHFGIFFYVFKFSISSKILFESSNFSFLNYYRSGLASLAVNNFVRSHKITNGIMSIFNIKFDLNNNNEAHRKEVEESVLEKISEIFGDDSVLFFAPEHRYGFFRKVESLNDNFTELIKKQFELIPKHYRTSRGELVKVSIDIGMSIYGLHNSSIESLIAYSTFALNTKFKNQNINMFSNQEYRKSIKDESDLSLLDQNIILDDYSTVFYPLWFVKDNIKAFGVRAVIKNTADYSWKESLEERIYYMNWNKIFYRYFANDAINKIAKIQLLIDYDVSIFEDQFSTQDFINQLQLRNINPQKIFLVIKDIGWSKVSNRQVVKEKIKEMMDYKINFVIDDKTSKTLINSIFKQVNFVMITGHKKHSNYKDATYIYANLKNINDVDFASNTKVDIVGGPIIKSEFTFKNFDKQSKIYLEELFKKGSMND